MSQIFVSYSRQDSQLVDSLIQSLQQMGYEIWLDRRSIVGGEQWKNSVSDGLRNSAVCVLVLTPDSLASGNVLDELAIAVQDKKPILPIRFQDIQLPPAINWLEQLSWIDFMGLGYHDGLIKLSEALNARGVTPVRAPQAPRTPPPLTLDQVMRMGGVWNLRMFDSDGPITINLNISPYGQFYGFVFRRDPIPLGPFNGLWRITPPKRLCLDGQWEQLMTPGIGQPWLLEFLFLNISANELRGINIQDQSECIWQRAQ